MSNKSLFSLAFIIGAATGSVVTWYLLKDKYEALAQEEIDSVKEVFLRREQELKDQSVKKTVAEGIKDTDKEKPDLKEYAERLKKRVTPDILISVRTRKKSLFLKPVRM